MILVNGVVCVLPLGIILGGQKLLLFIVGYVRNNFIMSYIHDSVTFVTLLFIIHVTVFITCYIRDIVTFVT